MNCKKKSLKEWIRILLYLKQFGARMRLALIKIDDKIYGFISDQNMCKIYFEQVNKH